MSGNSGFSGFGGRPDLDEDEGYDKKDESRDRRGKFFFIEPRKRTSNSFDKFNMVFEHKKIVPSACFDVKMFDSRYLTLVTKKVFFNFTLSAL